MLAPALHALDTFAIFLVPGERIDWCFLRAFSLAENTYHDNNILGYTTHQDPKVHRSANGKDETEENTSVHDILPRHEQCPFLGKFGIGGTRL